DVVSMAGPRGAVLGTAPWGSNSHIALRVLSRPGPGSERTPLRDLSADLLRERLLPAPHRRRAPPPRSTSRRRAHPAAPPAAGGRLVDGYEGAAAVQTVAPAMDRRLKEVAGVAAEVLGLSLLVERNDGSARDLEGLPRRRGVLIQRPGAEGTMVRFHDAGAEV